MNGEIKNKYLNEFVKKTGRAPTPAEEDLLSMIDTKVSSADYLDKVIKASMADREVKPQEPQLSELEKKKLEEYEKAGKDFQIESENRKKAEEVEAKAKELEEAGKKDIKKWAEGFYGETPRHTEIRNRLYKISEEKLRASPKKVEELEKERLSLLDEYKKLHYKVGTKTFVKVLVYRSIGQDVELRSEDNGHSWMISEYLNGMWAHGNFRLIIEDSKPAKLAILIENLSLHDFIRQGMIGDFSIVLKDEPDVPVLPKNKPIDLKLTETFHCPKCARPILMGELSCLGCGTPIHYHPPGK